MLKYWEFYKTHKPALVQKSSRINVFNALALPVLLYGSENRTLRENDKKRFTSFEIKFIRRAAGYTRFDQKKNLEIVLEVKAETVDEELRRYKTNWLRNVERINNKIMPKIMMNCRSNGR